MEVGEDWKAVQSAQRAVELRPEWPEGHLTLSRAQVRCVLFLRGCTCCVMHAGMRMLCWVGEQQGASRCRGRRCAARLPLSQGAMTRFFHRLHDAAMCVRAGCSV